ncbi:MAG: M48 family metalloprotease [Planctomycetaceae bacterium]|nr:M48 family metalloprotease [Planctomycetaceae bacterium]
MATVQCPTCGTRFKILDSLLGHNGRCGKCKSVYRLVAVSESETTPAISSALQQQSEKPQPPKSAQSKPIQQQSSPLKPPQPKAVDTINITDSFLANLEAVQQQAIAAKKKAPPQANVLQARRKLMSSLNGELVVSPIPAAYRLAMFVVGMFMCVLALVYFVIILSGFAGIYFYCSFLLSHSDELLHNWESVKGRPQAQGLGLILTCLPIIVIVTILFFMIKPLLFLWSGKDERLELTREREPFLFQFLDKLCDYVGAIPPSRVFINCDVNAAASFRHGIWSAIFGGHDCDLTLGLPLVAGMNMNQLVGVIAHEFGHFTQGGGMRFGNIIRIASFQFLQAAYGRDRLDRLIYTLSTTGHVLNIFFFMILRLFIWMTRLVLKGLMMLGFSISGYLSRQMEFDADQFEARVLGSKLFRDSTRRLLGLTISNSKSVYDVNKMFQDELLVDNYPRLIAANAEIMNELLQKWVDKDLEENKKTGWFDTHPSYADRIQHAEAIEAEGVIDLDCPATWLFDNFDAVSRDATWHFYTVEHKLDVKNSSLKNINVVISELQEEAARNKTVGRYFQGLFCDRVAESLSWEPLAAPGNPAVCKNEIKAVRDRIVQKRESLEKHNEELEKIQNNFWQLQTVTYLQNCKGDYSGIFDPEPPKRKYLDNLAEKNRVEFQKNDLLEQSAPEYRLMAKRLQQALSLICFEPVTQRVENGETMRYRAEILYPIGCRLTQIYKRFAQLYQQRTLILVLYVSGRKINSNSSAATKHNNAIESIQKEIFEGLKQTTNEMNEMQYPYDHAQGQVTLKTAMVPTAFDGTKNDLGLLMDTTEIIHDRLGSLLGRIYLELASTAEKVESVLGFPLLPNVPEKEKEEEKPKKKRGLWRRLLGSGKVYTILFSIGRQIK